MSAGMASVAYRLWRSVAFLNGVGRTTIVRAAYNMAEACARGRQVHVCCRPA